MFLAGARSAKHWDDVWMFYTAEVFLLSLSSQEKDIDHVARPLLFRNGAGVGEGRPGGLELQPGDGSTRGGA